jgi:signal transduction histidine kinase
VEEELGLRLTTVASAAVSAATPELLLSPSVSEDEFVRRELRSVADRHDLEEVLLVDTGGIVLFDLDDERVGSRDPLLDLSEGAFAKALQGVPTSSARLELGGAVRKAGFAPVEDWDGTIEAVLCVTVGGGFYARVPALRRTLFGVSVGSGAIVVLLGAIFFRLARRLTQTEIALASAETLSAMGMMAAGVAHEVRNPLSIISGTAERLKRKYSGVVKDPLFEFIPEEVERLNGILEGYLRFARDEPLAFVSCDLRRVLEKSIRLIEEDTQEGAIEIAPIAGPREVEIHADPHRLQQMFLNLFLNAKQAMPGGGRISTELRGNGSSITVEVSDTGPGFSEKQLQRAFQPFHTTKEKGSGLGLVMAKRIAEAHGGTIRLANRAEGGAQVTVVLPVSGAERPAAKES